MLQVNLFSFFHLLILACLASSNGLLAQDAPDPSTQPPPLMIDSELNSTEVMIHEKEFKSPLVRVQMDCQREKTTLKLNFTKPFNGIIGAGRLDTTKCKILGNGSKLYELQVKHNDTQCESQWDGSRSGIVNTLYIRFHSSLETGSDIAKNVMCRLTVGDLVIGRRPSKNPAPRNKFKPAKFNKQTNSTDSQVKPSTSIEHDKNHDFTDLLASDPINNMHS